jgi:hypothetical protein
MGVGDEAAEQTPAPPRHKQRQRQQQQQQQQQQQHRHRLHRRSLGKHSGGALRAQDGRDEIPARKTANPPQLGGGGGDRVCWIQRGRTIGVLALARSSVIARLPSGGLLRRRRTVGSGSSGLEVLLAHLACRAQEAAVHLLLLLLLLLMHRRLLLLLEMFLVRRQRLLLLHLLLILLLLILLLHRLLRSVLRLLHHPLHHHVRLLHHAQRGSTRARLLRGVASGR